MHQDLINNAPKAVQPFLKLLFANKPLAEFTNEERHALSSKEPFIAAVNIGVVMPPDFLEPVADTFLTYFDFMANEVKISLRSAEDDEFRTMPGIAIEGLIAHAEEDNRYYNAALTYEMVKILLAAQFPVEQSLIKVIADDMLEFADEIDAPQENVSKEEFSSHLMKVVEEEEISSGFDFCDFFADEIAMFPSEFNQFLLSNFQTFPWYVDALLLLCLHPHSSLAEAAAELLNKLPAKKWKKLSNKHYIPLVQRFGIESVKRSIRDWQSAAMKHAKNTPEYEVLSCHVNIPDTELSQVMNLRIRDKQTHIVYYAHLVYRIGYGLIDGSITPHRTEEEFAEILQSLSEQMPITQVNPLFVSKILPNALHQQLQRSEEKITIKAAEVLSKLPPTWLEAQPFNLPALAKVLKTDINDTSLINQERLNSEALLDTYGLNGWVITDFEDDAPAETIRARYATEPRYAEALANVGLMAHYQTDNNLALLPPARYVCCAKALSDEKSQLSDEKAISDENSQPFPLFDTLAQYSAAGISILPGSLKKADTSGSAPVVENPKGYVLKIELDHTRPKVWRRFTVSSATNMGELHNLIQVIMGWENDHLYDFNTPIGHIDEDPSGFNESLIAWEVPLAHVLTKAGQSMQYTYDFGDSWEHTITLEKINKTNCKQPVVTTGKGTCPPEDCGGTWGYENLLKMMKYARKNGIESLDEEEQNQLHWYGFVDDFDPSHFDKQAVNEKIK